MVKQVDIGRRQQNGVGREAWLAPSAAASIRRVDKALGRTLPVTWAGRTYAEQEALFNKYGRNPRKVARPGTSLHERGLSIDTDDQPAKTLAAHGWLRNVPSEPWHFTYFAGRDKYRTAGGGSTAGSASVRHIQRLLTGIGYKIAVDGINGPQTKDAIKAFQRSQKIKADGVWGPRTNAAYRKWLSSWKKTIKQGSKGTAVKILQWRLGLTQDSIFGPAAKAAVIAYQRSQGLTPDGIVGNATWGKLGYA